MGNIDGTYYACDEGMYPTPLIVPGFNTLDHWFPALDALVLDWLAYESPGVNFMEIGTFVGNSASILARNGDYLLCVDTWEGSSGDDPINQSYQQHDVESIAIANLCRISKATVCDIEYYKRRMFPDYLAAHLREKIFTKMIAPFSLIFIDGDHSYDSVKHDIEVAKQFICPEGIICGHDYTFFDGVTKAVNEFGFDGACGTVWWKRMP